MNFSTTDNTNYCYNKVDDHVGTGASLLPDLCPPALGKVRRRVETNVKF
jgi:hypothetical protein